MALDLNGLTAEVAAINDVEASALALINTIVDELAAHSGDQAAVDAITESLRAGGADLAAAVAADSPPVA